MNYFIIIILTLEPKLIDFCNPNPCVEGTCESFRNHYLCYCYEGHSGKRCNEGMSYFFNTCIVPCHLQLHV